MHSILNKIRIRPFLGLFLFMLPGLIFAQNNKTEADVLRAKIDHLSKKLGQLKAEQDHSLDIETEMQIPGNDYNRRDSLRLVELQRKQLESRARIDALTMDIIRISKQLEDPGKRLALAKKLKEPRPVQTKTNQGKERSAGILDSISTRTIDLAAVKLVREGKSLDQARLLTIEKLNDEQVLKFYHGLAKEERYKLYDIADTIVQSEGADMIDARRSAIYFYLYTKK